MYIITGTYFFYVNLGIIFAIENLKAYCFHSRKFQNNYHYNYKMDVARIIY